MTSPASIDAPQHADDSRPSRRRGRPRSSRTRTAILNATLELLREAGYGRLTMEGVAERARAGKATIYRWWPNKAGLVADAFLHDAIPSLPFPETGSVREDFRRQMQLLAQFLEGPKGKMLAVLIGQGQDEPQLLARLREAIFGEWRSDASEAMLRGIRAGQIRQGVFIEVALDAMYGPIFYRFLTGRGGLSPDYVDALCDAVMAGLAPAR